MIAFAVAAILGMGACQNSRDASTLYVPDKNVATGEKTDGQSRKIVIASFEVDIRWDPQGATKSFENFYHPFESANPYRIRIWAPVIKRVFRYIASARTGTRHVGATANFLRSSK